jgi:hypothetical protein
LRKTAFSNYGANFRDRTLGISAATIHRWLQKPEFQQLYRERRRERYSQIIGRAQHAAPLAARTLLQVMVDKRAPAAAQSRAARCILNRADSFRIEDLQAQIEKLEQAQRNDGLPATELEGTQFSGGHHQETHFPQGKAEGSSRKTDASAAKMERIILALLEHGTPAKAAVACGISSVTIWRWSQKPAFQQRYRKVLRESHSSAMEIMQQGASAAMSFQKRMLTDKAPAAVRVQATEFILDLASLEARTRICKRDSTF